MSTRVGESKSPEYTTVDDMQDSGSYWEDVQEEEDNEDAASSSEPVNPTKKRKT